MLKAAEDRRSPRRFARRACLSGLVLGLLLPVARLDAATLEGSGTFVAGGGFTDAAPLGVVDAVDRGVAGSHASANYEIQYGVLGAVISNLARVDSEPADEAVVAGSSVTFQVRVSGGGPFTFQWRRNEQPLPGETGGSLVLENAQLANAGDYDVVITGVGGSVTSAAATLTVYSPPMVTLQPVGAFRLKGQSVTFTIEVGGTGPLVTQWHKDSQPLPDANGLSLTLASPVRADQGSYHATVAGPGGLTQSAAAFLRVAYPQRIEPDVRPVGGSVLVRFGDADGEPLLASHVSQFSVDASLDLKTWTTVAANGMGLSFNTGRFEFEDANVGAGTLKFYRVREE